MIRTRPRVFLDLETTGLEPTDHIWEFAAIREEIDGSRSRYHCYVKHDLEKAAKLPPNFKVLHDKYYNEKYALSPNQAAKMIADVVNPGRPHIYGMVPDFDTKRLNTLLLRHGFVPGWHYHLKDIENIGIGFLQGKAANGDLESIATLMTQADLENSEALSYALGVDPDNWIRHTAMGDVLWGIELIKAMETPVLDLYRQMSESGDDEPVDAGVI